ALLDDLEADELEDVERAVVERRQGRARNRQLLAAGDRAVEPDDEPPAGTLRVDDPRLAAADVDGRAERQPLGILAGVVDDERPVEAVRAADAADDDEIRRGPQRSRSARSP